MQNRLMFIAGAGLGFVLGSRAGRGRYLQIKAQADQVWNDPRVQAQVSKASDTVKAQAPVVQEKAQALAAQAQAKVQEKAPGMQEKAQNFASTAQAKASDAAATVKAKVSGGDHTGNQIGVEKSSDVDPHDVKFESAE